MLQLADRVTGASHAKTAGNARQPVGNHTHKTLLPSTCDCNTSVWQPQHTCTRHGENLRGSWGIRTRVHAGYGCGWMLQPHLRLISFWAGVSLQQLQHASESAQLLAVPLGPLRQLCLHSTLQDCQHLGLMAHQPRNDSNQNTFQIG